ncbi:hypothetical protein J2X47_003244 [Sphingomonas sp. BE270]|nr:hypothetical protein [Sphingomonas sp. BE137]MDR7259048.1 hypothetical protein [Sphingomonas sp. BE270]
MRASICKTAEEWEREAAGSEHMAGVLGR